jgi:hypothetical protein
VLASLPAFDLLLWTVTTSLNVALLAVILLRKQQRHFPFFTAYLALNLLQTACQFFIYNRYGMDSDIAYSVAWSSQLFIVLARALVVVEFCRGVLARYSGIWALAIRILLLCASAVFLATVLFGRDGFRYAVMTLEIGCEAFIAVLVVGTFVFARYYAVRIEQILMLLGLGLGMNSCLKIINDLVLSKYLTMYHYIWNYVGVFTFAVVLLIWIRAMRTATQPVPLPELLPAQVYRALIPGINQRLWQLNEQLIRFWKLEQPKL